MTKRDAKLILAAVAKAVRERFVRKSDHVKLVERVAELEQQLAELKKSHEAA